MNEGKKIRVDVGTVDLTNELNKDGSATVQWRGFGHEGDTLEGPQGVVFAGQVRFRDDTGYAVDPINDRIKALAQEGADRILRDGCDENGLQTFKNLPPFPDSAPGAEQERNGIAVEVIVRVYRTTTK